MSLATSTSAKALQRPAGDKAAYLYDGSLLIAYWTGSAGQVAQVTTPFGTPSVTNQFTTAEDGVSIWVDNSARNSSYIWVVSSDDDASGAGPSVTVKSGTYTGGSFTWNTATAVPGSTQADTIQSTVTWNGTYLMCWWWDGASGTDRVAYNWTTDKTGQSGWLAAARAAVFSQADNWSTISQVTARHSANLGATIVTYCGNSRMNYGCMPDSANSGPSTGATLSATSTWSGTTSSSTAAGVLAAFKPSASTPVTSVGTPSQVRATTGSVTGSWGTGQNRTAGNILVAVVAATGTTSAATVSTPSGWTQALTVGGATKATIALYTKTAAGSDAAPAFTSTISGTATMQVQLFELANASATLDASGTATASASGVTVTTSGNIATNGDLAIAGFVRERAATTSTYTPSLGWANMVNDGSTSSTGHCAVDILCGPSINRWGGRTTFDTSSFTDSFGFGGPVMCIDETNGNIHVVKASPNLGGPTWTGIVYWLGTYNGSSTNTVTFGTRVSVDSTSTTTGPPDAGVCVDVWGKVYVTWVTDTSAGTMKYSTLIPPYTSATAGGSFTDSSGTIPRFPHVPAVSQVNTGLTGTLPLLYMDATSTPFPVLLDTTVSLPAGVSAATATGSALQPAVSTGGGDVTVSAGLAPGTAAAQDPAALVQPAAGQPLGTGTAQPPVPLVLPAAGQAQAAGTAQQPQAGSAGLPAGTAASQAPVPQVIAAAGQALGTGTAPDATASGASTAGAGQALGTGTAQQPAGQVSIFADQAQSTGTAQDSPVQVIALAGQALGTGTAQGATVSGSGVASAGEALATGTAQQPQAGTTGLPAATGTSQPPAAQATAFAGLATATGAGQPPVPVAVPAAGQAQGAGTPPPFGLAQADLAAGTGTASQQPALTGLASGAGTSQPPAAGISAGDLPGAVATAWTTVTVLVALAGQAQGTGTAWTPNFSGSGTANAGLATGTGTAWQPSQAGSTGLPAGAGSAPSPTTQVTVSAGLAAAAGTAQSPFTGQGVHISDTDSGLGQDSGFAFLSDSDISTLLDAGELFSPRDSDSSGRMLDGELSAWPSDKDASSLKEAEAWSGPQQDGDTGGLLSENVRPFPFSDTEAAACAEGQVIEIWTNQPPFRWTGGNYQVVHQGRTLWRGLSPDRYALLLAEGVASGALTVVHDSDSCRSAEDEVPVLLVFVTAEKAVAVALSAERA